MTGYLHGEVDIRNSPTRFIRLENSELEALPMKLFSYSTAFFTSIGMEVISFCAFADVASSVEVTKKRHWTTWLMAKGFAIEHCFLYRPSLLTLKVHLPCGQNKRKGS